VNHPLSVRVGSLRGSYGSGFSESSFSADFPLLPDLADLASSSLAPVPGLAPEALDFPLLEDFLDLVDLEVS
jgi:hypothetical protein